MWPPWTRQRRILLRLFLLPSLTSTQIFTNPSVSFKVHLPPNLSPVPTCPAPILHVNPAGASTAIGFRIGPVSVSFFCQGLSVLLRPGGRGDEQARPETGCRVVQDTKNFASQQFCAAPPPNCFQAAIQAFAAVGSLEKFLAKLICSLNGVVLSILRFASKLCMWTSLRVQVQSNYLPKSARGDQEAIPAQSIWHQSVTLYWVSSTAAAASSVAALPSSRCYLQCAFAHLDLDTLLSKHLGLFLFDKTCFKAGSVTVTVWESGLSFQTWCGATLVLRNNQHQS